jgi:hypothetical protein
MKHVEIWFGNMTHGQFLIGSDSQPMVIVNSIEEKAIIDPVDVEEYMLSEGHDSYLIPSEFKGDIVFSQDFFKGLSNVTN